MIVSTAPVTECPKCGKRSIVSPKDGTYQCLSCDFKRDLNPPSKPQQSNDTPAFLVGSLGFLVVILLFA